MSLLPLEYEDERGLGLGAERIERWPTLHTGIRLQSIDLEKATSFPNYPTLLHSIGEACRELCIARCALVLATPRLRSVCACEPRHGDESYSVHRGYGEDIACTLYSQALTHGCVSEQWPTRCLMHYCTANLWLRVLTHTLVRSEATPDMRFKITVSVIAHRS